MQEEPLSERLIDQLKTKNVRVVSQPEVDKDGGDLNVTTDLPNYRITLATRSSMNRTGSEDVARLGEALILIMNRND